MRTDPLNVFIHVPKTAGSTINRILQEHDPSGIPHCEALIDDPLRFERAISRAGWVSGHVDLTRMENCLAVTTRRKCRFFTLVRDPLSHVASHYNWLIEIANRGKEFYMGHPEHIRAISRQIRESDNADPLVIINNLKAHPGLFLNAQARYVMGAGFDWNSGQVLVRLERYECSATQNGLPALAEAMTGKKPELNWRENESPYHFDREIFQHPEILKFLAKCNFLDEILYGIVTKTVPARFVTIWNVPDAD